MYIFQIIFVLIFFVMISLHDDASLIHMTKYYHAAGCLIPYTNFVYSRTGCSNDLKQVIEKKMIQVSIFSLILILMFNNSNVPDRRNLLVPVLPMYPQWGFRKELHTRYVAFCFDTVWLISVLFNHFRVWFECWYH